MKPMLDNDIDNLFKSSLQNYEVTPSKECWKNIKAGLNDRAKKNNQFYWLAAASVIVFFGLGINFFGTTTEVIKLRGNAAKIEIDDRLISLNLRKESSTKPDFPKDLTLEEVKLANEKHFLSLIAYKLPVKEIQEEKREIRKDNNDENVKISNALNDVSDASKTKQELVINNLEDKTEQKDANVAFATNSLEPSSDKETHGSIEKSRIKTVGDLFNFVIAKVDGREQKLLHFSKTEESDMELTQINLGLFRYKKN